MSDLKPVLPQQTKPATPADDPAHTHPWGAEFKAFPRSDEPAPPQRDLGPLIGERKCRSSFDW